MPDPTTPGLTLPPWSIDGIRALVVKFNSAPNADDRREAASQLVGWMDAELTEYDARQATR